MAHPRGDCLDRLWRVVGALSGLRPAGRDLAGGHLCRDLRHRRADAGLSPEESGGRVAGPGSCPGPLTCPRTCRETPSRGAHGKWMTLAARSPTVAELAGRDMGDLSTAAAGRCAPVPGERS